MNCAFSRELLALHVENDLPDSDERVVANHLLECAACQDFLDELRNRQSQLKMLRRDTFHPSEFASMRRDVLSRIENSSHGLGSYGLGWRVRIERMLFLGFRRHTTVFASIAIAVAVSATLLAQMRNVAPKTESVSLLSGGDTLVHPDGYRDWVSVGSSIGPNDVANPHVPANPATGFVRNIYINRPAYREFSQTGKFPEGSILMMELSGAPGQQTLSLEASVKDSRFDGGWGYFDFTGPDGKIKDKAQALPNTSSCRTCHEDRAKVDHVFTQFHPAMSNT